SAALEPLLVGGKDRAIRPRDSLAAKHGVEPVQVGLDVFGGRLVAAGPVTQVEIVAFGVQLVNAASGAVGLFDGPDAFHAVIEGGGDQARRRRDTGDEFRLVDGEFVFASGEEPEPGREPVGEDARDVLDALAELDFGEEPPRAGAPGAAAARD